MVHPNPASYAKSGLPPETEYQTYGNNFKCAV